MATPEAKGRRARKLANWTPCKFFAQGRCSLGQACTWLHGPEGERKATKAGASLAKVPKFPIGASSQASSSDSGGISLHRSAAETFLQRAVERKQVQKRSGAHKIKWGPCNWPEDQDFFRNIEFQGFGFTGFSISQDVFFWSLARLWNSLHPTNSHQFEIQYSWFACSFACPLSHTYI